MLFSALPKAQGLYDPERESDSCGVAMVAEDSVWLHDVVSRHVRYTDSTVARSLLSDWPRRSAHFTKIMPTDYQRVLQATRMAKAEGRDVDTAIMEASRG